jgi:DNA (cytosine-5)-methyltransferase 1
VLLENVDRLLNSPGNQRGRDFAIILSSLAALKYDVEWRVINAADYGEPQRRRRIFILAIRRGFLRESGAMRLTSGLLAKALPCRLDDSLQIGVSVADLFIEPEVHNVSARFGRGLVRSPFRNAGFMRRGEVWTRTVRALYDGKRATLGEILQPDDTIAENYVLRADQLRQWRYLKEAKSEPRTHKASGAAYTYAEGALPFPDPLDRPSRTILTGEGGSGPSRFKHVVAMGNGELRRLVPEELERLNGFPAGWTRGFMTDGQRAFCMGNALVVGIVRRIADVLARELSVRTERTRNAKRKESRAAS